MNSYVSNEIAGKRLRDLRKKRGLTLKEVSQELKIAENTLCSYEKGTRRPKAKTMVELANFYNVLIQDIFFKN